jgi:hypothetical protein
MSTGANRSPGSDGDREARIARAQSRLYLAGAAILVLGSAYSVWIYRTAATLDARSAAIIAAARNTKTYEYQMETYGGKSNLLATEVREWFSGLWQGRHLADTVAVLTFSLTLLVFAVAYFLPDLPDGDDGRGGAGGRGDRR